MTRATLRGVDFRKARFDRFALASCLFLSCDFRAIHFDKRWQPLFSARPQNVFRDCHFDGADMRRVRPDQARFERCTFDDAALDGWRTEAAEFVGCRIAGLDMLKELSMRFRDQTEIIASRVSASGPAARVQTRVWAALEHAG